ncbi:MAG: NAD(P)/FAD-dependent oxidoreductase [Magnetospirillum sp. WYHS-4]
MTEAVDCLVVGAGVVGLAIARALVMAGREVVVLEAAEAIGTGISARSSEVVHAGLYYPPGSLKARLCVEGKPLLYAFMAEHGVAHRRPGKLLVATDARQIPALEKIVATARINGVDDLQSLDTAQVRALEPDLRAVAAVLSPSTGILDSHGLMLALRGEAEAQGAMIAFRSPLLGGRIGPEGIVVRTGGEAPMDLACRVLVNAAGLGAQAVAASLEGLSSAQVPPRYLAKGNYFALSGRSPFRHLIYPVPEAAGLGIHLTLDLGGQARFGPDVEWVETEDYQVDPARVSGFAQAVRTYWPGLPDGALRPGYAGIRPKIQAPGEPAADFRIEGPADHGIPGLVNLFGIESPGLTACLAIARHVTGLLE